MTADRIRRTIITLALTATLLPACALEPARGAATGTSATATVVPDTSSRWNFCKRELGGDLWSRTELFFGLNRPGGTVTEAQFQAFVDAEVTPRFPDGLTLLAGKGQFRGADGAIEQEGSKLLILLYPYSRARSKAVEQIRVAYKRSFDQQSVLRTDASSCISF